MAMWRHGIGWSVSASIVALLAVGGVVRGDVVGKRIEWETDSGRVRLVATALAITANGKVFTVGDAAVTVHGDRGDGLYWTLEAEWAEQGAPMRLYVYFMSDGTDWWASSIRTYDGSPRGEWVVYEGPFFRTPLGKPFAGDLDLTDPGSGCTLRLANLRIETTP